MRYIFRLFALFLLCQFSLVCHGGVAQITKRTSNSVEFKLNIIQYASSYFFLESKKYNFQVIKKSKDYVFYKATLNLSKQTGGKCMTSVWALLPPMCFALYLGVCFVFGPLFKTYCFVDNWGCR